MRDGAEKINIDGTHKQSCRKRESNLDGDIYHYILDSNLTDDMQNNNEYNDGTPHAFTGLGKDLRNQPHHPHHLRKHIRSRSDKHTSLPIENLGFQHKPSSIRSYKKSF
jgi:hypothetical protein